MTLTEQLSRAYERKAFLVDSASPSHPNFDSMTDEEWTEAYNEITASIYALEAALSALDPL